MRRREFVAGFAAAATLRWSRLARAQTRKVRTIGFLAPIPPTAEWLTGFQQRLRELGWIEGTNLTIEYRWAEGRTDLLGQIAFDFVSRDVDVIVTAGTPSVLAAKRATAAIPIVFVSAGDPVATGLVASLAHPGGNITGSSLVSADLSGKRLQLLREAIPDLSRLALMANMGFPEAVLEMREAQAGAKTLGLEVFVLKIQRSEDIVLAIESTKGRAGALYVCGDPLILSSRVHLNTLALFARLPTMHGFRDHVEAGGLMSYGPNFSELFRRAADYANKILRGTSPADIPVEQPTKFDFAVNLKTAKALGLTVPASLVARADEVIE